MAKYSRTFRETERLLESYLHVLEVHDDVGVHDGLDADVRDDAAVRDDADVRDDVDVLDDADVIDDADVLDDVDVHVGLVITSLLKRLLSWLLIEAITSMHLIQYDFTVSQPGVFLTVTLGFLRLQSSVRGSAIKWVAKIAYLE